MKKKILASILVLALGMGILTGCSSADEFPSEPITLTVPFGAGGTADLLARAVAEQATDLMGQAMGVVNRDGAGGVVGLTEFVAQEPDGYNLISANVGLFAITSQTTEVEYSFDDIIPVIGNIGQTSIVLSVSADSGIENFADFLAYAQENGIIYSVIGMGSDHHILQAALYAQMGIEAEAVSYDSATEPIASVLGGNVDVISTLSTVITDYVDTGELIPILSFNDNGVVIYGESEEVPSAVSLGYDVDYSGFGFYALPADTPDEIVEYYTDTFAEIYEMDEIQEMSTNMNFIIDPLTPDEIEERINKYTEDVAEWLQYIE